MANNENKNNNKSLFLYTALIFFVAVVLIILSFFGERNMEKNQPELDEAAVEQSKQYSGITEKAFLLSEENRKLLEQNKELDEKNKTLTEEIEMNDLLLSANGYFTLGNKEKALEILNTLDYDKLSVDQQIIYNNIKNN